MEIGSAAFACQFLSCSSACVADTAEAEARLLERITRLEVHTAKLATGAKASYTTTTGTAACAATSSSAATTSSATTTSSNIIV